MTRLTAILSSVLLVAACGTGNSINGNQNNEAPPDSSVVPDTGPPDSTVEPDSEVPELCGNSVIDPGEVCDGPNFGGMSCHVLGFEGGELSCTADCQLNTSACVDDVPECGDNAVDPGEQCDGLALMGLDCSDLGFNGGTLACQQDCQDYDVSACWMTQPVCGNGVVEPGETCDDGNHVLTDQCPDGPLGTCLQASCGDGFVNTTLDATGDPMEECDDGNHSTTDDCPDGPTGSCMWTECGDGFVHGMDETCDDGPGGTCYDDCSGSCGDGVHNPANAERCDGTDGAYGFVCYADCSGFCGDGILHDGVTYSSEIGAIPPDHGEMCDGPEGVSFGEHCTPACEIGFCGDGHCGGDEVDDCNLDCDCVALGGIVCAAGCCYGGYYTSQPAQCCATGCVVYDTSPFGQPFGVDNCGSCGNFCMPGQYCLDGQCT